MSVSKIEFIRRNVELPLVIYTPTLKYELSVLWNALNLEFFRLYEGYIFTIHQYNASFVQY